MFMVSEETAINPKKNIMNQKLVAAKQHLVNAYQQWWIQNVAVLACPNWQLMALGTNTEIPEAQPAD